MSPRILHVANGTSTTGTIAAAGIPGERSIWADPLYEGPVPGSLGDADLVEVRQRFLAGPSRPERATTGPAPERDPVNGLRAWRAALARTEAYDELLLWFEHDLFDQLNLIQLLSWIQEHLLAGRPVSLICIGSFPGRPEFRGLGQLTPDELRPLLEIRRPVGEAQYQLARRAWQAFGGPTPEALESLAQGGTAPLPYLAPALRRFLQEYPWTRDGLSRTERRLLALAGTGTRLSTLFPRILDEETAYYVTDSTLAGLADTLSRTDPPLLTIVPPEAAAYPLQRTVALTDAGRSVLTGRVDRVAACGLDRWFGGVHLERGGRLWRWDEARGRLVSD